MEQQTIIIGGVIAAFLLMGLIVALVVRSRMNKASNAPAGSAKFLANSLRDEKLKSEIILNSIEDGVVLLDEQKIIQLFNPGASNITGWRVQEAQGLDFQSVVKLVDDKDNAYADSKNPFNRAYKEGTSIRDSTAILVSRSDKRVPLSLTVTPLIDDDEQIRGAVAIFRDVSIEREREQRAAEFISTASHEMRTPVAAIEGYLSLSLNDKVSTIDTRARGYLEKAHYSTQHLGQLFQDLLTSAKAEDGRLTNHPSVVEMGEFLEQLAQDLRFSAEKKNLPVEFVVGTHTASARGGESTGSMERNIRPLYYTNVDPDRVREVVTNLFDNAVKYTAQGKISIGLTGNDSVVQMYIRDTGPGIATEDVPHLFQKFYRVDNSATRTIGGTGLGLFICKKIIELYRGKLWVESKIGEGSTFYINLPRLSSQQAEALQKNLQANPGQVVQPPA
jgi:PAS domain S-box-containing protein